MCGGWEVESQRILRSRMGYQQEIMNNGCVYRILHNKLHHAWCLVRVRLVLLRSCGGHTDMLLAVMSTLFVFNANCALALLRGAYWHAVGCDVYFVRIQCYTLLYTFPWHNENECCYAYQQMHSLHAYCDSYTHPYKAVVVCIVVSYHIMNY